jgi:hypothetical protein
MPLSTAAIPSLSLSTDIATLFGPVAVIAVAAVLIALVVLIAGMAVEALDARARARLSTRAHARSAASGMPQPVRRRRAA